MTALTPEQQAALEKLRDIRLPEPIGWWPLAPGWWALIALAVLLLAAGVTWTILRRRTRRFAALRELDGLRAQLKAGERASVATDLAALVRRVALAAQGRHLARLSDADWAAALAQGRSGLPPEIAALITELPYRRPESFDGERLMGLIAPTETWIRRTA